MSYDAFTINWYELTKKVACGYKIIDDTSDNSLRKSGSLMRIPIGFHRVGAVSTPLTFTLIISQ